MRPAFTCGAARTTAGLGGDGGLGEDGFSFFSCPEKIGMKLLPDEIADLRYWWF